jgi:hypothetical protein
MHICTLGDQFAKLGKMGKEDVKLLELVFSRFVKKIRIGKPDGKLLEMLKHARI